MHTTALKIADKPAKNTPRIVIGTTKTDWAKQGFAAASVKLIKAELDKKISPVLVIEDGNYSFVFAESTEINTANNEKWRKVGAKAQNMAAFYKLDSIALVNATDSSDAQALVIEGFVLANYKFHKYKTLPKTSNGLVKELVVLKGSITEKALKEIENLTDATLYARDLVNEPLSYLTAEQLSVELEKLGKEAGFSVEVFDKKKIKSLKMGGLIAVNLGSPNPPTFNILEYKPKKAVNKTPIVLVGKGVVYDTGGLSLKPTPNSMDQMKCDMGGAASVAGAFYAAAKNELPIHLIGLIPATENRPGGNAYTPGDVIVMHSGLNVEVLNTDAEGRMILADALSYAKKYKPELVIDLATLTGAAARAIGAVGAVYMGNAGDDVKKSLADSGNTVYERLVEFPMWDEYDDMIVSDVADIKNVGGATGGATTAGMFLRRFTDYPWIHIDIAGPAFLDKTDGYRLKNGSGYGVRLLYDFLKKRG